MENRRNYYRILQVQPDAPFEVVHASYCTHLRELKQHPDLGGDHWNASLLNEAYNTLNNRKKRAEYDKELFYSYTKKPVTTESSTKRPIVTIFCPVCNVPLARKTFDNETCPICKSTLQSSKKKDTAQSCRRSINRKKITGKICYTTSFLKKEYEARMVDLSPSGMRFISTKKLKHNKAIKISSSILIASAKVKNSQLEFIKGKKQYAIGILFMTVAFTHQKGTFVSVVA